MTRTGNLQWPDSLKEAEEMLFRAALAGRRVDWQRYSLLGVNVASVQGRLAKVS